MKADAPTATVVTWDYDPFGDGDGLASVVAREHLGVRCEAFQLDEHIEHAGSVLGWSMRFASGALMEVAIPFTRHPDHERVIYPEPEALVILWDATGARVYWGDDNILRGQTPESVLSLIRMVAKESAA